MKTTPPVLVYDIIYADDHALVRHAISEYINLFKNFRVIKEVNNGKELIDFINLQPKQPDIVLLDIEMPIMGGYDTADCITKQYPQIKIIMLTVFDSKMAMALALQSGAFGYISKAVEAANMESILLRVTADQSVIFGKNIQPLNKMEQLFLKWLCTNLTYSEISEKMNIPLRKIERTREKLFKELNMNNRTSLALFAMKNGLGFIT